MNQILFGDCLKLFSKIKRDSMDMVFADPPFNLNKKYTSYHDGLKWAEYMSWCREWILELVRITKPTGSIFIHNIPKWLTYYANILNEVAFFKHWISWEAPTSPMGKSLQPANYGILFYAKEEKGTKIYELRHPHKRERKSGYLAKDYGGKKHLLHPFGPLVSDVWTDIHRIKHSKNRNQHPCQLPLHLLDRMILLSTDEGDIVFDPFMGTGTTAISAKRLGRNFVGFECDLEYHKIATEKTKKANCDSKVGDIWVSYHRNEIITIRNQDWEGLREYFNLPESAKDIDMVKANLKREYDILKASKVMNHCLELF